jgi:CheY-like chemotaxis protein
VSDEAAVWVLVVDDEEDACSTLADIFGEVGYRVDTAHDGPAAMELLRRRRYDVALLDLMMPGMDGAALYEEMQKVRPEVAALLVTAYPGHPRAARALARGVSRLLPKPVDVGRLLGAVDEEAGRPLVLVVDDEAELCLSLQDVLHQRGYRVCLAHDARTASERVREGAYRVILLDMRLPDGDGGAVFRAARQADPGAAVVVITGHHAELEDELARMRAEGARAVLSKPFDVPELLEVVRRLAGG